MGLLALLGFEAFSLCSTFSLFYGESIFAYRYLPKGNCRMCCPIEKDKDITFNLFTRENPITPHQLYLDEPWSVKQSNFNPSHTTVVYVHGFTERTMGASSRTIKEAYLQRGEYNLISVDWGPLCAFPYYAASARNSRVVGPYVAEMLRFLEKLGQLRVDQVHVIGFSLGAEVAAFAGKTLGEKVLPRITGLDPAFPLYIFQGLRGHLEQKDAKFVDVIHTDGGVFGFPNPIGDVDFFPNKGVALQPGCRLSALAAKGHPEDVLACSHNRAWMYYAESVLQEDAFPAMECESPEAFTQGNCTRDKNAMINYMGIRADPRLRGSFFLTTMEGAPFGKRSL